MSVRLVIELIGFMIKLPRIVMELPCFVMELPRFMMTLPRLVMTLPRLVMTLPCLVMEHNLKTKGPGAHAFSIYNFQFSISRYSNLPKAGVS